MKRLQRRHYKLVVVVAFCSGRRYYADRASTLCDRNVTCPASAYDRVRYAAVQRAPLSAHWRLHEQYRTGWCVASRARAACLLRRARRATHSASGDSSFASSHTAPYRPAHPSSDRTPRALCIVLTRGDGPLHKHGSAGGRRKRRLGLFAFVGLLTVITGKHLSGTSRATDSEAGSTGP